MGSQEALPLHLVLALSPTLPCTKYPQALVGTDGPECHSLPARPLGAQLRWPALGQSRGDKGSDVYSSNEFFKIAPDGNSVLDGDLGGHAALHESHHLPLEPFMLVEKLYCVSMMLQEHLHLLVKLSGSFKFPGNQL